jgi:hypothetical protein
MLGILVQKKPLVLRLLLLTAGLIVLVMLISMIGCGKTKEIIKYRDRPASVSLIYPMADSFITIGNPSFFWHKAADIIHYQLQLSPTSDFVAKTIDVKTTDTTHTAVASIPNSTYFWRVRGDNADGVWGDWSDADIWTFIKSDYVNFIELKSETETYGIPQDVFVRGDTAYLADGQADLTLFDISGSNRAYPLLIRNVDLLDDDFSKGVFVAPLDSFPHAYVADMDGRIQAINLRDSTGLTNGAFGSDQNLEDVTGVWLQDTLGVVQLWIVAVSSGFNRRKLSVYQMLYDIDGSSFSYTYPLTMPADANGLCLDSTLQYAYVACGTSGLRVVDFHDPFFPTELSFAIITGGSALSVDARGDYVYLAADRGGVVVVNIADKNNPVIRSQVNTSGRTKDIQVIGDHAFIADGSGGLKVVDISNPDSAHFVAAYTTPYAYGLWAASDYIYLCDRDLGLMTFENKVSR